MWKGSGCVKVSVCISGRAKTTSGLSTGIATATDSSLVAPNPSHKYWSGYNFRR